MHHWLYDPFKLYLKSMWGTEFGYPVKCVPPGRQAGRGICIEVGAGLGSMKLGECSSQVDACVQLRSESPTTSPSNPASNTDLCGRNG